MINRNWLIWAILVLILANGLFISFMLLKPSMKRRGGPRELGKKLERVLELTPEQAEQYRRQRKEHHEHILELNHQNAVLLKAYFQLIKEPDLPLNKDSLEGRMAEIQVEKARITLKHFQEFKGILDSNQAKKLDREIPNLLQVIQPGPPKP